MNDINFINEKKIIYNIMIEEKKLSCEEKMMVALYCMVVRWPIIRGMYPRNAYLVTLPNASRPLHLMWRQAMLRTGLGIAATESTQRLRLGLIMMIFRQLTLNCFILFIEIDDISVFENKKKLINIIKS